MTQQSKIRGQNILSRTVGWSFFSASSKHLPPEMCSGKQFSAPFNYHLIQKVNEKKKRKCFPTTSDLKCFCWHVWGHLSWQENSKRVLLSFPFPERKIPPSNRRKMEESYWWWWWWLWNPSVESRPCSYWNTAMIADKQRQAGKKELTKNYKELK